MGSVRAAPKLDALFNLKLQELAVLSCSTINFALSRASHKDAVIVQPVLPQIYSPAVLHLDHIKVPKKLFHK